MKKIEKVCLGEINLKSEIASFSNEYQEYKVISEGGSHKI